MKIVCIADRSIRTVIQQKLCHPEISAAAGQKQRSQALAPSVGQIHVHRPEGNTLLHMAIRNRHMTAALLLAESGMVNTPNAKGETPMQAGAGSIRCRGSESVR